MALTGSAVCAGDPQGCKGAAARWHAGEQKPLGQPIGRETYLNTRLHDTERTPAHSDEVSEWKHDVFAPVYLPKLAVTAL